MCHCLKSGRIHRTDIQENDRYGDQDHGEIIMDLFHGNSLFEMPVQKIEIKVKINTEQDHKDGDNPLNIGGVPHYAVVLDAKATGTCRTECSCQCIKQWHMSCQQENKLDHCHAEIDRVKDHCSITHFWNKLSNGRSRAFCAHQIDAGATA